MNILFSTAVLGQISFLASSLNFYQHSGLSAESDQKSLQDGVEAFLSQVNEENIPLPPDLQLGRDFIIEDFDFPPYMNNQSKYAFVIGFEGFLIALMRRIQGKGELPSYSGFVRKESPSLEVYDFRGHNKLNIKVNSIRYSSLYK